MMFQGTSSRSLTLRILNKKNSTVVLRITALLCSGANIGTNCRAARITIAVPTITSTPISFLVIAPSLSYSSRARSRSPGIDLRSGR